jgi:CubicO group peptidase (beta-lactamase class C family)
MLRSRGFAAAAAGIAVVLSGCATVASNRAARLEALFADLHQRGLFEGAVVVAVRDEVVWEKGFGYANAARGERFTPDTAADGASLAKTFTAALLIRLHREGRLDLDAPAQRLLPELPYPGITLRHLLSHSSGLPWDYGWFDPFLEKEQVRTTEVLLQVVAKQQPALAFPPGTQFEYSSFGFDLAALAAARATRESYGDLLSSHFFRPLGLSSAFLRPGRFSDFPGIRTIGYRLKDGKRELHEVFDLEAFHGGSNIYISARDLHRWNAWWFRARLDEALAPARIGESPSGITLGSWYHAPDGKAFWYSGHLQGFHDEVYRDLRTGHSIVYVSNNTLEPWLQHAIVRAVDDILGGGDPGKLEPPPLDNVAREARPSLAGSWMLEDGDTYEIESSAARLFAVRKGVRYWMVPVAPNAFYVPGLDDVVGFRQGKIYVSSHLSERWGSRK